MQSSAERDAADARTAPLGAGNLARVLILGACVTLMFTLMLQITALTTTSESGTRALGTDYRVFWAAGQLALDGQFLAPFDMSRLAAVHGVDPEKWMPWLYPPGYLFLIAPLGALPFVWSFLAMTIASLALLAVTVRPFAGGSGVVWLGFVLAPACLPALLLGQNSLIWLAGLLAALAALRDGRPVLAGVLIGCLTLKPQLGLMIPVALLAAGQWRAILAASVTALLLAALPTLLIGPEYWTLFLDGLGDQRDRLIAMIHTLDRMVGPLSLLVLLGFSASQALVPLAVLALISALAVFLLWRSSTVGFDAKVAGLLTAMFLSAPYFWYYEAALMALTGLFMVRAGLVQARSSGLFLLALLWIGGGAQVILLLLGFKTHPVAFLWAAIMTPTMLVCLGICLRHFLHQRPTAIGAA